MEVVILDMVRDCFVILVCTSRTCIILCSRISREVKNDLELNIYIGSDTWGSEEGNVQIRVNGKSGQRSDGVGEDTLGPENLKGYKKGERDQWVRRGSKKEKQ